MSKREQLLHLVANVPSISSEEIASSAMAFPRIEHPQRTAVHQPARPRDITLENFDKMVDDSKPIDRLFKAIRKASSKLEYGKTPLSNWRQTLVFAGDKVKRDSKEKRFNKTTCQLSNWKSGTAINQSQETLNNWFVEHLIPRILSGGNMRHSTALIGAPGSGKSTVTKYVLSEHAATIRQNKLVFSRFEFLKFWQDWRRSAPALDESLTNYLSFIHARDLVLDHFFDFEDGCRFSLKFPFRHKLKLQEHLRQLQEDVHSLSMLLGHESKFSDFLIEQTVAKATSGNKPLMDWLRNLPTMQRILLIGVLWGDRCLVTIFDGLDTLRIEDAFQNSEEWDAVVHIIKNREMLSAPSLLGQIGKAESSNSIVVMRNNTAAILEFQFAGTRTPLGFQEYFNLGNLDGLTAMHGVLERAAKLIPDMRRLTNGQFDKVVFDLMVIAQRTVLAIWRGQGASVQGRDIYEFFDGNLRDLFSFLAKLIVWTVQQMLSNGFLDSHEYYSEDTSILITALSSERGSQFLKRKSYRIVELLLFEDGAWFENNASIVSTTSPLMSGKNQLPRIVGNPDFSGHVDNIFNYTDGSSKATVDQHALLEKIRIVQICSSQPILDAELEEKIQNSFGYKTADLWTLVRFLLKTDFLEAEVVRVGATYSVYLKSTTRGRLCVASLIRNLSYLEHVFHQTYLPASLINCVNDQTRDENSLRWAAHSIRNAYILLVYFKHLEANDANGRIVPSNFRLFKACQKNIINSLARMTRPGAPPEGALERSKQIKGDASWICDTAVFEIEKVLRDWHRLGIIE